MFFGEAREAARLPAAAKNISIDSAAAEV